MGTVCDDTMNGDGSCQQGRFVLTPAVELWGKGTLLLSCLTRHNGIHNPLRGDLIHRIPAGHAERSPCPPCGTRKMLRAYADPCIFRPLRKRSPRFFCHRQREGFFPPCAGKALTCVPPEAGQEAGPQRGRRQRRAIRESPLRRTFPCSTCGEAKKRSGKRKRSGFCRSFR